MSGIGVYLHIPFCKSRCTYCDFVSSTQGESTRARYLDALTREIFLSAQEAAERKLTTLYFGGGTPSLLSPDQLGRIVKALKAAYDWQVEEFTVECNPCTLDADKAQAYRALGVTRVSLGVQTLNDDILRKIGRRHDAKTAIAAFELCKKLGYDVSVDAMLGLPDQTDDDVRRFVDVFGDLGADHVSAYQLSLERGTPLAKQVKARRVVLPEEDRCVDWYESMYAQLERLGYRRYEVSNFARNGKECRHNLKYWRCENYLGLGVSAHGLAGAIRYANPDSIDEYCSAIESGTLCRAIEQILSEEDRKSERIMLALRLSEGLNVTQFEREFDCDFVRIYEKPLKKHASRLLFDGKRLAILPQWMNVMNAILSDFI